MNLNRTLKLFAFKFRTMKIQLKLLKLQSSYVIWNKAYTSFHSKAGAPGAVLFLWDV